MFFFFTDPAPPTTCTLSLHDALPISSHWMTCQRAQSRQIPSTPDPVMAMEVTLEMLVKVCGDGHHIRSEEHTSELQSRRDLVCRLLLEKKKRPRLRFAATGPVDRRRS